MQNKLGKKVRLVKKLRVRGDKSSGQKQHKPSTHKHTILDVGKTPKHVTYITPVAVNGIFLTEVKKSRSVNRFKFRVGAGYGRSINRPEYCTAESPLDDITSDVVENAYSELPHNESMNCIISDIQSEDCKTSNLQDTPADDERNTGGWGIWEIALPATIILLLVLLGILFIASIILAIKPQLTDAAGVIPQATVASTVTTSSTSTSTTSTTSTSTTTTSTMQLIVCKPPYIRFGAGCCLDANSNRVCDSDEALLVTSTTLPDYVFCSNDNHCGPTRVEYVCRGGNVHRMIFSFICKNPGTRQSNCERNVVDDTIDMCASDQECVSGKDKCQKNWAPNNFMQ